MMFNPSRRLSGFRNKLARCEAEPYFACKIPQPMYASKPSPEAGKRLKAERLRVRLSTREVARRSQVIADRRGNQEYGLSHAWLTEVETGKSMPGIFRLHSLSLIYGRPFHELVAFYGINIRDIGKDLLPLGLPQTHLIGPTLEETRRTILAPVEMRATVQLEKTNLVSRMFQSWGEIPIALLQQMDWRNSLYGYIGLEDYTMYPFLRPGSFVEIDSRQKKITTAASWEDEFDRPIYFVELRDDYVCSWCELDAGHLILVPCPHSRRQIRQVRYPGDADIVGRVTAVTMRIAASQDEPAK
jgi:transcriptional regulator with XRE-family HTH domain